MRSKQFLGSSLERMSFDTGGMRNEHTPGQSGDQLGHYGIEWIAFGRALFADTMDNHSAGIKIGMASNIDRSSLAKGDGCASEWRPACLQEVRVLAQSVQFKVKRQIGGLVRSGFAVGPSRCGIIAQNRVLAIR